MDTDPATPGPDPRPAGQPADRPLVLRGTAQLLATVPHLLGYRPARSLVVLGSVPRVDGPPGGAGTTRCEVVVTARLDLPDTDDVEPVVGALVAPLHRTRLESGTLLLHAFVYDADPDVAGAVATALLALADADDHVVHDLVLVADGHYLPAVAGGLPVPVGDGHEGWLPVPPAADVPAVADLVLQGRGVADSREAVAARVRHLDERAAAATELAISFVELAPDTCDPFEALGALSRWVVDGQGELAPRERARLAVVLADRTVRDAVLARWLPRLFTVDELLPAEVRRRTSRVLGPWAPQDPAALDRLLTLASQVPRDRAVPLLTIAGAVAWGSGEGTVANEAVDLALETDPDYRMAGLLRLALDQGLPPWVAQAAEAA